MDKFYVIIWFRKPDGTEYAMEYTDRDEAIYAVMANPDKPVRKEFTRG